MQSYTLAEACNPQGTVFNRAAVEPVLLTDKSQPSHVIMSADAYQRLIERLIELEDMLRRQSSKICPESVSNGGCGNLCRNTKTTGKWRNLMVYRPQKPSFFLYFSLLNPKLVETGFLAP